MKSRRILLFVLAVVVGAMVVWFARPTPQARSINSAWPTPDATAPSPPGSRAGSPSVPIARRIHRSVPGGKVPTAGSPNAARTGEPAFAVKLRKDFAETWERFFRGANVTDSQRTSVLLALYDAQVNELSRWLDVPATDVVVADRQGNVVPLEDTATPTDIGGAYAAEADELQVRLREVLTPQQFQKVPDPGYWLSSLRRGRVLVIDEDDSLVWDDNKSPFLPQNRRE